MNPLEGFYTLCGFLLIAGCIVAFVSFVGWIVAKIDPEERDASSDEYDDGEEW